MPQVPDSKTPLDLYTYDTYAFHLDDYDMKFMKPHEESFWASFPPTTTEAFRRQFERALIPYTKGDWTDAKKQMEECLKIVPDDMPALHILRVMEEYKFLSPPSWKGYRDAYDV